MSCCRSYPQNMSIHISYLASLSTEMSEPFGYYYEYKNDPDPYSVAQNERIIALDQFVLPNNARLGVPPCYRGESAAATRFYCSRHYSSTSKRVSTAAKSLLLRKRALFCRRAVIVEPAMLLEVWCAADSSTIHHSFFDM